jgi:ubiquitin-protein ligase
MEASRGTALYDGIDLAVEELVRYSATYPDEHMIKKRIICLTDGEDNRSRKKVYEVSRHLQVSSFSSWLFVTHAHDYQDNGVILDAVCLRGSWKSNLETLSYLTGGYRFRPKTINDVMTICELEPVLSLHERPDIILPTEARQYADSGIRFQNAKVALSSARDHGETNDDTLPPLRPEPEFDESFVRVRVFKRNLSSDVQAEHNADLARGIKILDQVRLAAEHNQDNYDIYICERNFRFWKIVMTGPDGSAYENGTFLLTLKIAKEHPAFPPEARFVTPTYHPNVNKHGKVCHSVLDRDWTADTKITHVLDNIFTLLLVPEFLDPVNTLPTLDYHHDPVEFREQVAEHVQEHATRTREEWRRVIEKGDVEMS